jgi:nucleoside recognition membrane protein YjiH
MKKLNIIVAFLVVITICSLIDSLSAIPDDYYNDRNQQCIEIYKMEQEKNRLTRESFTKPFIKQNQQNFENSDQLTR